MILAVAKKELLGSGRRGRWFAVRAAYLVLLAAITIPALLRLVEEMAKPGFHGSSRGREFTVGFGLLQMALVFLLGPALSIGSITAEKASGVMDLLHVAGVRPAQIVAGKFLAKMSWLLLCIASAAPLLFAGTLMGGAGAETVALIFAHCVAVAVVGTALGLTVSGVFGSAIPALVTAYLFLILVYVFPYLVLSMAVNTTHWMFFTLSAPLAIDLSSRGTIPSFFAWQALLPQGGIAALVGMPAILFARPADTDTRSRRLAEAGMAALEQPLGPLVETPGRRSVAVVGNPIAWREARTRRYTFSIRVLRLVYLSIAGAVGFHMFAFAVIGGYDGLAHFAVYVLLLGSGAVALVVSATAISAERESRALGLLTLSRLSGADILAGKLEGIWVFLWPVALLPLVPALAFLPYDYRAFFFAVCGAAALFFAGSAIGLLFSVWSRSSIAAVGSALTAALVWVFLLPTFVELSVGGRLGNPWDFFTVVNPAFTLYRAIDVGRWLEVTGRESDFAVPFAGILFMFLTGMTCLWLASWKLARAEET